MSVLKDSDKKQVQEMLADLKGPVELILFTQEFECDYCKVTRDLLTEVADLSDKLSLEIRDFVKDGELAEEYGVDKIPAIVMKSGEDQGIRFFGVPGGYEFSTLIEDIQDVAGQHHGLSDEVLALLAKVDQPVHMQVMITPT